MAQIYPPPFFFIIFNHFLDKCRSTYPDFLRRLCHSVGTGTLSSFENRGSPSSQVPVGPLDVIPPRRNSPYLRHLYIGDGGLGPTSSTLYRVTTRGELEARGPSRGITVLGCPSVSHSSRGFQSKGPSLFSSFYLDPNPLPSFGAYCSEVSTVLRQNS